MKHAPIRGRIIARDAFDHGLLVLNLQQLADLLRLRVSTLGSWWRTDHGAIVAEHEEANS